MRGRVVGEKLTDDEVEAWNERAGILEFCAGFSRQDADRLARVMVLKARAGAAGGGGSSDWGRVRRSSG